MFNEDIKKIKSCIEYKDYYNAMEYALFVKEKYKEEEKKMLNSIIIDIKNGEYDKLKNLDWNNWNNQGFLVENRNLIKLK